MKRTALLLGILATAFDFCDAQSTVGYVKDTLSPTSDTIVTLKVHRAPEYSGAIASVADAGSSSTFTLSTSGLTAGQFVYVSSSQPKTYYALVTAGTKSGSYFAVTANTASTLTVNNLGLALSGSGAVTSVEIRPFSTLGSLFPVSDKNVSFVPSTGTGSLARKTKIFLPNNVSDGVNKAARASYFYRDDSGYGYWVSESSLAANANDTLLNPDEYITVRNNGAAALTLTQVGDVLGGAFTTYAGTSTTTANDVLIGIPRPIDYKLSELGLVDGSNFMASTGTGSLARRDQILVIDKTGTGYNRASSVTYYRYNSSWYQVGSSTPLSDATIPMGSAIMLRKYKTSDGADSVIVNQANYNLNQ